MPASSWSGSLQVGTVPAGVAASDIARLPAPSPFPPTRRPRGLPWPRTSGLAGPHPRAAPSVPPFPVGSDLTSRVAGWQGRPLPSGRAFPAVGRAPLGVQVCGRARGFAAGTREAARLRSSPAVREPSGHGRTRQSRARRAAPGAGAHGDGRRGLAAGGMLLGDLWCLPRPW